MLGVCEQTIRNWIAKNRLPPPAIVTERGWRLWSKSEIERLAQERAGTRASLAGETLEDEQAKRAEEVKI
jgi:predicted DNA-binding transcriptional regulator AlpA